MSKPEPRVLASRPPTARRERREKTKGSELAFAAPPGSYPPPGTLPNSVQLLVERVENQDTRFGNRANAGRIHADHCIFFRAECANAGLVDGDRCTLDGITYVDAGR